MKYSFIIPYYKRADHLWNTLISYRYWYGNRKDYEIIIIEDGANIDDEIEHLELYHVLQSFKDLNIIYLQSEYKRQFNPVKHRNWAVSLAKGDILVMTNPECYHKVNILEEIDKIDMNKKYIVCACEECHLAVKRVYDFSEFHSNEKHIQWFQHSIHNNRKLHFCTIITKEDFLSIGGFDEAYAAFCGFDDDDFRETIIKANLHIIVRDDFVTVHTQHSRIHQTGTEKLTQDGLRYYNKKWGYNRKV